MLSITPETNLATNLIASQTSQESSQGTLLFSPKLFKRAFALSHTSPDGFRKRVNEHGMVSKLRVLHHKSHTILFDQQRKVCAVIAAPGLNEYGKTQPIKYYFPTDEQNTYIPKTLLLFKNIVEGLSSYPAIARHKISKIYHQLSIAGKYINTYKSARAIQKTLPPISTSQQTAYPVWTTLRLTA